MKRRFLSVLLALSMVLTLAPAAAWADELPAETATQETPVESPDITPGEEKGPEEAAPAEDADTDAAETPAEDEADEAETDVVKDDAEAETPDAEAKAPEADAEEEGDAEEGIMLLAEPEETAGMPEAVGGVITLTKDVTLEAQYEVRSEVTIDLNGHSIASADGKVTNLALIAVLEGGSLTIKDSGKTADAKLDTDSGAVSDYTGGSITHNRAGQGVIIAQDGGKLTIEDGKISNNKNTGLAVFAGSEITVKGGYIAGQEGAVQPLGKNAVLNIEGGVMHGLDNGAYMGNGLAQNGGTVTNMTGGTLVGNIQTAGYISCGFYHPQSGELNISGGTIYCKDGVAVCIRNGSMNIEDGATLISKGDSSKSGKIGDLNSVVHGTVLLVDYAPGYAHNNDPREISITGGKFEGAADDIITVTNTEGYKAAKNFVQGGTFNKAVGETYVADGFECKAGEDGTYGISAKKLEVVTGEGEAPTISGVYVPEQGADNKGDGVTDATQNKVAFDASKKDATEDDKKAATVNIEPSTVGSLADAEVKTVEIKTNAGTVTLDAEALAALNANAAEKIGEATDKKIELLVKQAEDKPATVDAAYEISLAVSGDDEKTSLLPSGKANGNITITVNYDYSGTLNEVYVYYVADGAPQEQVGKAKIDKTAKTATFTVNHLSTYAFSENANLAAKKVAKIGNEYYESLRAAVTAANSKEGAVVIELLQNVPISGCIDINKDITIKGSVTITAEENEGNFTPSTDTSHGSVTNSGAVIGANSMFRVAGTEGTPAKLTLEGVTLDANNLCRGIFSGSDASLVINEGTKVTNGYSGDANYVGGVFIYGGSSFTMNGGEITGNRNSDEYNNDGFLQYTSDLWIGNDAAATLNGGKVGNMMVNATTNRADSGGKLSMPENSTANVTTVFVEAGANHSGKVINYAGGKIGTILLPLGYSDENDQKERPIASIPNPENGMSVGENDGSFKIPDGATATIIQEGKLTNGVTIGTGATLVIPADKTVTVVKPADGDVPAITNNGTLQVDGKLIAGAGTEDAVYVNITNGAGAAITGNGTIDLDPDDTNITTLTFTFHPYDGADNVVVKAYVADGAAAKFSAFKPADPTRTGYTFNGWFTAETGGTKINDADTFEANTDFYAQWSKTSRPNRPSTGGSGGGGGASSVTATITISGDGSSIKADVKISNGTATIGKAEDIKKVIGKDVVTIDASNLKKDVDTVKVDSSIVNAIANNEDSEGLEIKLSDGTVTFDADAVAGFKGGDLSVTWDKTNTNSLNSKQKDAVKDMDVQGSYKLTFNKALKNGEAEIRAAFAVPDGKSASDLALVRVGTDGTTAEVSARFSGGELRFTATESGDYVVVARAGEQTAEPAEPTTPVQNSTDFRDVDAGAWYGNAVNYVAANGLMSGVGDGLFAPNTNLSRAMLAQILYNHAGRPAVNGTSAFTDVPEGMWFTNAVAWATAQGVVSGYGSGLFGPNDNITREQLAVMLFRYAGSPAAEGSLDSFADAGKVSAYAQNALIWATTNGVMSGKGGGNLDPAGLATRAEVAQMLYNYLNR